LIATSFISAITVDEIVANNLKVKGGADAVKAIKTVHISGNMKRMGMEMKLELWNKMPSNLRMDILFSGKKMTFGFDGKDVWQISPFTGTGKKPQLLTGDQAEEIKDNADEFEEMFLDYKKKGYKIELLGKEDMEGTTVYKLKLTKKDGKEMFYFIDTDSFIELKVLVYKKKNDNELKIETFYGDFKEVNGVMMPHTLSIKMNGQDMGTMVFEKIEANIEIKDTFFKMPKT
jgi:hypothetical protein